MTAPQAITLPGPAYATALRRRSISLAAGNGPKEQGRRLRGALFWATQTLPDWADACRGLRFDLVCPSFSPARLEVNFANGGCALVRIDGDTLVFHRIEPRLNKRMEQRLPSGLPI